MKPFEPRRLRRLLIGLALATVLLGGSYAVLAPALRTGAGAAAHHLCSSTFVSQVPEQQTRDELLAVLLGPARRLLRAQVDRKSHSATAGMLFETAEARFVPGFGCRLALGDSVVNFPPSPTNAAAPVDAFAPADAVEPADSAVKAVLDSLFAGGPGGAPPARVKAIVVVKNGRVVAERYAPGFGVATPVVGFSVAKSVTNALLGVLVRQNRLSMSKPAPVPEWRLSGDRRGEITPDNLLRMTSGLDARESGTGFDPVSRMLYDSNDMAAFSAGRPLARPPGSAWEYTSSNTLILDRLIGDIVGGGPVGLRNFAQRELFGPLGIDDATLEFDGVGTFVGSLHFYASARSFARFGLLYLNDGVAPNGERILPEGWVEYSRRPTLDTPYGAGFWTNDGGSEDAAWRVARGFPKDGFFASGNLGQRIYIIPSEQLVIARFGYSAPPTFGMSSDIKLIATAIARLHE